MSDSLQTSSWISSSSQAMYSLLSAQIFFLTLLSIFTSQQAFNATVAINHMKKLQLAHSELVLRKTSIPDIKVSDVSTPPTTNHKRLDPGKPDPKAAEVNGTVNGPNHMSLPTTNIEPKSQYHMLKATQSQCVAHHAPTIAEQGKNVYHSEPSNLNGFVQTKKRLRFFKFWVSVIAAGPTLDDAFLFLLSGMVKPVTTNLCRPEFAQSCEGCMKFTWIKTHFTW